MSDLVFKHIPKEGFDPNTGFSERTYNPTPSRRSSVDGSIPTAPTEENNSDLRLSHPMPSGRSGEDLEAATIDSRASNPTPTRRRTMTSVESDVVSYEGDSRPSNPTPRRCKEFDTPVMTSTGSFTPEQIASRASNPTPTRQRTGNTPIPEKPVSLSFSSVGGAYGTNNTDGGRASNPTPTRRTFDVGNAAPEPDFDDRLSNYTPSEHR